MGRKKEPVIVGEYEIIKQIGEGGFAYTYLAKHTLLGTYACLKQNIDLDDEDRAILLKEAKLPNFPLVTSENPLSIYTGPLTESGSLTTPMGLLRYVPKGKSGRWISRSF